MDDERILAVGQECRKHGDGATAAPAVFVNSRDSVTIAATDRFGSYPPWLTGNLDLDELRQKGERFLPAETAGLGWDDIRDPFLGDVQFRPAGYLLQADRHLHLAGQVRIVKLVRVPDTLVRHQFEVLSAEGVAVAGAEVCERHPVGAADLGV